MNEPYDLYFDNFKIEITLFEIKKLLPHEEVIEEAVNKIVEDMVRKKLVKHPIIVDKITNVILDGMHRFEALKRLGVFSVPVVLIDYINNLVEVQRWIRKFKVNDSSIVRKVIKNYKLKVIHVSGDYNNTFNSSNSAFFISKGDIFLIAEDNYIKINDLIKKFDNEVILLNGKIEFITEEELLKEIKSKEHLKYFYIIPQKVTKREVIENAKYNILFPAKTTRHIFPAKVYNVNYPIDFLKNDNLEEAKKSFLAFLKNKKVVKREPPCIIEERLIDHVCFIFE